jgi:hypothetical protein
MILPTGATVAVAYGAPGRGRERQFGDGSTLSRSDAITIPRHMISPAAGWSNHDARFGCTGTVN